MPVTYIDTIEPSSRCKYRAIYRYQVDADGTSLQVVLPSGVTQASNQRIWVIGGTFMSASSGTIVFTSVHGSTTSVTYTYPLATNQPIAQGIGGDPFAFTKVGESLHINTTIAGILYIVVSEDDWIRFGE